ncbi:MAG: hypothetical protein PVJ86_08790 [Phycisphaerales bacterium]|jgi:hypothetical protein
MKLYNFHINGLRKTVHDLFLEQPEWAKCLAQYQHKMESGFFPFWYTDAIVQHEGYYWTYDIYDAFCFAVIHTAIKTGDILTAQVDIGETPSTDKNYIRNNYLLQMACKPFWGEFWGEKRDTDGLFGWRQPVIFGQVLLDGEIREGKIGSTEVPLEVGYTNGSRTLLHLCTGGGLARWPYGSPVVHLFKRIGGEIDFYSEGQKE